jgi:hypothetical protein
LPPDRKFAAVTRTSNSANEFAIDVSEIFR